MKRHNVKYCSQHIGIQIIFIVEQNLVGISSVILVVFYRRLGIYMTLHEANMWKHDVIHKTGRT